MSFTIVWAVVVAAFGLSVGIRGLLDWRALERDLRIHHVNFAGSKLYAVMITTFGGFGVALASILVVR